MSLASPVLNIATTLAFVSSCDVSSLFHHEQIMLLSFSRLLSLISLRNSIGMSSGPSDFLLFNLVIVAVSSSIVGGDMS